MASVLQSDYTALLGEIKQRIRSAQYAALKAVNKELIALYWDIGRMIVERQAGKSWGRAVIAQLAADLQTEFPGVSGYSSRNLWYTRSFYLCYGSNEKLQLLVAEIGWTHNLIIMEKCKDDLEKGGTAPDYFHSSSLLTHPRPVDPDIFLDKIFPVVNNHVEDSPDESIWRVVYEF